MKPANFTYRGFFAATSLVLLTACASGPKDNISLIPADEVAEQTSKDGLFTQPIRWERTKPGCTGQCPTIKVESITFPGVQILSDLVDHALAVMTGVSIDQPHPYDTIAEYQEYFWKTAAERDSTFFSAKARYRNKNLSVIELNTWQYFTGAAHGISATQYLNWNNNTRKVLGLSDVIQAGKQNEYIAALQRAHEQWLTTQPDALNDLAAYKRLWPFQPSENFALTDIGMIVKYDSYQLAPYSSGQPELIIPYSALVGTLRSEYVPGS